MPATQLRAWFHPRRPRTQLTRRQKRERREAKREFLRARRAIESFAVSWARGDFDGLPMETFLERWRAARARYASAEIRCWRLAGNSLQPGDEA